MLSPVKGSAITIPLPPFSQKKIKSYSCSSQITRLLSQAPNSLRVLTEALKRNTSPDLSLKLSKAFYNRVITAENLDKASWALKCFEVLHHDIKKRGFVFSKEERALFDMRATQAQIIFEENLSSYAQQLDPTYLALHRNVDLHPSITDHLSCRDARSYLEALHVHPDICQSIERASASPACVFETFEDYCKTYPQSFLALVCNPAIQRLRTASPSLKPITALNNTLSMYLGKTIPRDLIFSTVEAYFQEAERFYHEHFHRCYSAFFEKILTSPYNTTQVCEALEESLPTTEEPLTPQDIARIINKFHDPSYRPVLDGIVELLLPFINGSDIRFTFLPPELRLLSGLRNIDFTGHALQEIRLRYFPNLENLCIDSNQLRELDLKRNPHLVFVNACRNPLERIRRCPAITPPTVLVDAGVIVRISP